MFNPLSGLCRRPKTQAMKRILILLIFICTANFSKAQSVLFEKVKQEIADKYPGLNTDQKLIAVNFWSMNDPESRERNRVFNRNYNTYKFAKLIGGRYGMLAVAVCIDEEGTEPRIAINRDGAKDLLILDAAVAGPEILRFKNIIFDAEGNIVYKDLAVDEIPASINKLITR
jgi:hypothetical protein